MTREQAAALLDFAAILDSRVRRAITDRQHAAATIRAWAKALDDVPATAPAVGWDIAHAVRRYYEQRNGDRSAQYRAVEPHDLLAAWAPYRAELMKRHTDPVPDVVGPDGDIDATAYRQRLAADRRAVATGHAPPAPYDAALNPTGQRRLAALTGSIGTSPRPYLPAHVADQLAAYRPTRAAREAALAAGGPDPLAQPCAWCRAATGEPCRGGFRPHGKGRAVRRTPHPCRVDAARAAQEPAA